MSDTCSSRRPNFVRWRHVFSESVSPPPPPYTQKCVLAAFTKRKVPYDSEGSHAATELWVLTTELRDTFLTHRILKWLLDILEDFLTAGARKCWLSVLFILYILD
jgi:hypothetical protein